LRSRADQLDDVRNQVASTGAAMSEHAGEMQDLMESRILLVDDEAESIKLMRAMLSEFANLRFATSGRDALHQIRAARPDLVVVDFNMPGMTGLQLCEQLQLDPALANLPVIVATADRLTDLESAALQRGAVDFITKPLNRDTFLARVRAHLRSRSLSSRLSEAVMSVDVATGDGAARLLVVDDDVSAIKLMQMAVHDLGAVHFATTGDEALRKVHEIRPDLVLLDASMPGVDGFSVCAALKSQSEFAHVPIVFITRYADAAREKRALELGAADFVSKPFDVNVLRARLQNLLKLKARVDNEIRAVAAHGRLLADSRVADIVRTANDGIITIDASEHVLLVNEAAARLLSVDEQEVVGRSLDVVLNGFGRQLEAAFSAPARLRVVGQDGTLRLLEVRASRAEAGNLVTLFIRDVTERERLELAQKAQIAAESSTQAKSRLIAWVSHEMGAPLNAILGFAQVLGMAGKLTDPADQTRLQQIMDGANQIQSLLADLMDISRHESGTLSIAVQPIDALEAMRAAVETVRPVADRCNIKLGPVPEVGKTMVLSDPQRLRQCLINLLSNAVKYNRDGGRASLAVYSQVSEVWLAVRDEGIGMDAEQLSSLCEPFNRLGREKTAIAGAGLGLVISKSLVEAMGGRLDVESEPGIGTQFTLKLKRP
jgi:PAS domain S-box-containing protein